MADILNVLGIIGGGNKAENGAGRGREQGGRNWKKDDCSKSKSWSKSRGHKKACKH